MSIILSAVSDVVLEVLLSLEMASLEDNTLFEIIGRLAKLDSMNSKGEVYRYERSVEKKETESRVKAKHQHLLYFVFKRLYYGAGLYEIFN